MIKQTLLITFFISLIIITQENHDDIQQNIDITCLCIDDDNCDSNNQTCHLTDPEHACYESWTKEPNNNIIRVNAGCVYNDFLFTKIYCNGNQTNHYIICCSDKHYCNDRDVYSGDIRKQLLLQNKYKIGKYLLTSLIFISFILLLLSLIIFILFCIKQKKYLICRSKTSISDIKKEESSEEKSESSSGYGAPLLTPITFAKQIILDEQIGVGGYGCVYRGKWREDIIAVKIFLSSEEPSWNREVFIYQEQGLNHENILRYIAADNKDISNRIELWLATEYHANGSVYDYLMNHTITIPIMIKMMLSIANGLCHLHLPIDAAKGKVALAHRDLKTKNILVKKDLSCCIADLGLAVREVRQRRNNSINNDNQESIVIDVNANHRVGTIRYMAPEVLDKTLNDHNFESYKAADLYALGLVFWEILRRCQTTSEKNDVDIYKLPYEDILPNNPSFEQMHEVVCILKNRPLPSPRWEENTTFRQIFGLCEELWTKNPVCRPSSYVIMKQLKKRSESIENESLNKNMESRNEGPLTV